MKKIYYLITALIVSGIFTMSLQAQLSDRVNSPSTLNDGTRPVSGNMGFFIGASVNDVQNWLNDLVGFEGLPLMNLKYYLSSDLVARASIEARKYKVIEQGDMDGTINLGQNRRVDNHIESELFITPGVEKHFASSNIGDAYVGAGLPLGVIRSKDKVENEYDGGDYDRTKTTRRTLVYGLDVFFGMQIFIADLPIAVGAEFGLSGLGHMGNKYKSEYEASAGGVSTSQTVYTVNDTGFGYQYSKLKSNDFDLSGNVTFTFSYFFKR